MGETNPATIIVANIIDKLSTIFSTVSISGINIIISGHILGYLFSFNNSGKNHFTLLVPPILHLGVRGVRTFAGFAAFTISMLVVGYFLPEQATKIVIENMHAPCNQWTATQLLAASLSVVSCLILCAVRSICTIIYLRFSRMKRKAQEPTNEERVRKLIET